jgi:hypothetical protein
MLEELVKVTRFHPFFYVVDNLAEIIEKACVAGHIRGLVSHLIPVVCRTSNTHIIRSFLLSRIIPPLPITSFLCFYALSV